MNDKCVADVLSLGPVKIEPGAAFWDGLFYAFGNEVKPTPKTIDYVYWLRTESTEADNYPNRIGYIVGRIMRIGGHDYRRDSG